MVKSFREIKASKIRKSPEARSARSIKALASNAQVVAREITQADAILNKVHAAFDDSARTFEAKQVRQIRASLSEVSDIVAKHMNYCKRAYAKGLKMGLDMTRVAEQIEDLSELEAKATILKSVADASMDEEIVDIDEVGHVVAEDDEEEMETPEEEMMEESLEEPMEEEAADEDMEVPAEEPVEAPVEEEAADEDMEVPAEEPVVEEPMEEEAAEEDMDAPEDLSDMEFEDPGVDSVLSEDIMEDEMIPLEDEEEPELEATASLKSRKLASAKRVDGTKVTAETDVLASIMSDILR